MRNLMPKNRNKIKIIIKMNNMNQNRKKIDWIKSLMKKQKFT